MLGFWYALGAYLIWGCFPLFFHLLADIDSSVVLAFRIVFGFCFALALMLWRRQGTKLVSGFANKALLGWGAIAAVLISINWFVFIWAVAQQRVLETSLGYFMTPLISLLLGRLILNEQLNGFQWLAGGIAALAILFEMLVLGGLPWLSLVLAVSFGVYGLVRKKQPLESLHGLTLETLLVLPIALIYLVFFKAEMVAQQSFYHLFLLIASGVLTAIPLLLFAASVRSLNLVVAGFMMYLNPLMQFIGAVWILGETMPSQRYWTFALVWLAMVFFVLGTVRAARQPQGLAVPKN